MTTFADELNNLGNALLTSAQEMRKLLGQNDYTKYQKIGSNLSDLARSYSNGVMRLMEYGGTPQEFRQFKDVASDVMKSIDNIRDSSSYYYEKAGKAVERAEKVAQRIEKGSALASMLQMGLAMKEAAQTGNYDKLGETATEVLGSWFGGLAGVAIGGAIVALGAPAIVVAIMAGIGAWLGAELGELVWNKLFKPAQEWLSYQDWLFDKFDSWFGINRTGLFHIYDPLVLDLDGDGIELVNADGWNGVQFDYNGNGIQTATQWVKPDDGLLVWDRNNNGVIDDGSELFGQDTPHRFITEPVTDGFTALRTVESHPDGEINAKDHEWKNLKVWRDLNQDGKTQKGELFSLNELGITGLDLNTGLAKGTSTFTTQDGKKQKLADVNFNRDTVHSEYKEHIALTEEQLKLPNLHGVGMLRDLREAANNEFFAQYTAAFQAA